VFSLSASLYSTANSFVLGLRSTATEVAFYGGAEKTHRAFLTPFGPLGQALYPHMVEKVSLDYKSARASAIKMLFLISSVGLFVGILAFAGATLWVRLLLGPNYTESVLVLQIMALQLPLTGASRILGLQWMMPLRMESILNVIVIAGGITNIALAFILAPVYGAVGMAIAFVTTEAMITIMMAVAIQRSPYRLFAMGAKQPVEA
jgi:PST family polysaccharide transporter